MKIPGTNIFVPRSHAEVETALRAIEDLPMDLRAEAIRAWLENAYNRGWAGHQSALSGHRPVNGGGNPFWPHGKRPSRRSGTW